MTNKPNNIRALERTLDIALRNAIGAMRRLSYARDAHGIADPRAFFLACEVDAIRAEHREELKALFRASVPNAFAELAKRRAEY